MHRHNEAGPVGTMLINGCLIKGAKHPDRFVNVGIAERNMIGVGNGLANGGMVPYLCGASCFLTARGMEQVKVDMMKGRTWTTSADCSDTRTFA